MRTMFNYERAIVWISIGVAVIAFWLWVLNLLF